MTIGQILDRIFRLLRGNFKLLVGIASVIPAVLFLAMGCALGVIVPLTARLPKDPTPAQNTQIMWMIVPVFLFIFAVCGVAFAPSFAAGSKAAVEADFGVRITIREAYAGAFQHLGRNLLLLFLIMLVSMGPLILVEVILGFVAALAGHSHPASSLAFLVGISVLILLLLASMVYSILATLRLSLAFAACVMEDLSAVAALKRSNQLTRGARGRIFLVLLIGYAAVYAGYAISLFAFWIVMALVSLFGLAFHWHAPLAVNVVLVGLLAIAMIGIMVLYMALSGAVYATSLAVIYNDQRVRIDDPPANLAPAGVPG